jgi:hypothetical protein
VKGSWAEEAAAAMLAEGWVEVEKAPTGVVAEGKTGWVAEEEGGPGDACCSGPRKRRRGR